MANEEKKKDLLAVLWSGADILRSKMDANEYKNYLLSFVFYKYLSDSYLVKAYDLIYDEEPKNIAEAQKTYEEAYEDKDLLEDLKDTFNYIINYTVYLVQKMPYFCGLFSFHRLQYIPKSCSFSNKLVTNRYTNSLTLFCTAVGL